MKILSKCLFAVAALASIHAAPAAEEKPFKPEPGFVSLFDGKSLDGWKVGENAESFSVKEGAIVANGKPAHLFYDGEAKGAKYKNFELRADVMTKPSANGGIYISTSFQEGGWPTKSYEVQVNNSQSDWRRSGSLYTFADNKEAFEDNTWMAYVVVVKDGKISITINGKELVKEYKPEEGKNKLMPEGGTIALQAHDPGSTVLYKNLRIKSL